jgi:hypothetical protein
VKAEGIAGDVTEAGDDIEDPIRDPGLRGQLRQPQGGQVAS